MGSFRPQQDRDTAIETYLQRTQLCLNIFPDTKIYYSRFNMYEESSWNLMAHGDAREGNWRGNWRMEWVASTLTLPRDTVYPLLPLMSTPRLPAIDWTDGPADLNGLVLFAERPNLVSARVPSRFKRSLPLHGYYVYKVISEHFLNVPYMSELEYWSLSFSHMKCNALFYSFWLNFPQFKQKQHQIKKIQRLYLFC